jgi:phosphatidylinositol-3-phosphatase
VKAWFAARLAAAIAGAASLTGKRFGLLVASSVVATSAIVAAGLTSSGKDNTPLAALVGRSLASQRITAAEAAPQEPVVEEEAPEEEEFEPEVEEEAPEEIIEEAPVIEEAPAEIPVEEEAAPEPEPEPEEEAAPPPPEKKPEAGRIKHVFVVNLASSGYATSWDPASADGTVPATMPYLSETLRPQGTLLTNYKLLGEKWLPNSLASVGGQKPTKDTEADCPKYETCLLPAETLSFADQLGTAQYSWRAYLEGMADPTGKPANCVHPEPGAEEPPALGAYAPYLNPFIYFHSLLDLGECSANDVPLTELEKDLRKTEKTPNFSYIQPDLCDAGVLGQCEPGAPEGAAAADAWLATWIPKIIKSPAYKADGLVIVTFGAVNPVPNVDPTQPPTPPTSLKTGTLLVSRFLQPGATDGARYDPYSLLATNEDLFGLGRLGEAGGKKVKTLGPQLLGTEENGGD